MCFPLVRCTFQEEDRQVGLVDCYTGALDGVPLLSKEMQQTTGDAEAAAIQRVAAELSAAAESAKAPVTKADTDSTARIGWDLPVGFVRKFVFGCFVDDLVFQEGSRHGDMQIRHPRDRPTGFTASGFDADASTLAYSSTPVSVTPVVQSRDLTALTVPKPSTTPDVEMADLGGSMFDVDDNMDEAPVTISKAQTDKVRSCSLVRVNPCFTFVFSQRYQFRARNRGQFGTNLRNRHEFSALGRQANQSQRKLRLFPQLIWYVRNSVQFCVSFLISVL